jgi:hypothetical protein
MLRALSHVGSHDHPGQRPLPIPPIAGPLGIFSLPYGLARLIFIEETLPDLGAARSSSRYVRSRSPVDNCRRLIKINIAASCHG